MNLLRHMLRLWLVLAFSGTALAQTITVYSNYRIEVGASRQLTAYVPLSPNTVTWTVNGIPGGDATVGTISPSGLYRAPANVPPQNAVKVRATSTAYPTKYGEATMTVTQVGVHLWSSSPSTVAPGAFTLRLNGSNFTAGVIATFGGVPLATTRVSATELRATGSASAMQAGTQVPLVVVQSGLGATTSETVMISVGSGTTNPPPPTPGITVAVSPTSVTLAPGTVQNFGATVTGSTNTSVAWSVNGIAGGNATVGTITAAGLYTAPAAVPSPGRRGETTSRKLVPIGISTLARPYLPTFGSR